MKKRNLLLVAMTVAAMALSLVGCGGTADAPAAKEVDGAYYTYTEVENVDNGGANVIVAEDASFYVYSDGTYMLTTKQTMDITEPSAGYLKYVGGMKVAFGKYTVDEDDPTAYTLEKPDRMISSAYMMSGPNAVTEIYVDSADADSYANYSVSDITGKTAEEVIDILQNTSYTGKYAEGEAVYTTTVIVNLDTFMIQEMY